MIRHSAQLLLPLRKHRPIELRQLLAAIDQQQQCAIASLPELWSNPCSLIGLPTQTRNHPVIRPRAPTVFRPAAPDLHLAGNMFVRAAVRANQFIAESSDSRRMHVPIVLRTNRKSRRFGQNTHGIAPSFKSPRNTRTHRREHRLRVIAIASSTQSSTQRRTLGLLATQLSRDRRERSITCAIPVNTHPPPKAPQGDPHAHARMPY
jgi:hypothetical protein